MRQTATIIIIIFLSFCQSIAQEDLPDGPTKFYYGNGQVSSEGIIRNGKPDGLWKTYYVDGSIKSIGLRRNFQLDSVWQFYDEQGFLTEEISYLRGKRSGYHVKYQHVLIEDSLVNIQRSRELFLDNKKEDVGFYYDKNGKIDQLIRYKDGKKHGLSRQFDKDSVIKVLYKYHNDFLIDREFINETDARGLKQGLWKTLYDNDNIQVEANYLDGILHGYYREYNERGQLLVAKFYQNGEEVQREEQAEIPVEIKNQYDANGRIIASGGYIQDTPVGIHREYTDNKSVIRTVEFSNSGQKLANGITDEKGQKDEFWQFFYPGGGIKSEGNFRDNTREGVWKFYYPNGQLEQTGSYRAGRENGLWTWYYEDGSTRREENYYRGLEDGQSIEYDRDGNIIAQGEFIEGMKEGPWYHHVGDHTEKGVYRGGQRDGLWEHYYLNEVLKFSGSYVQGFENGRHKLFYESGKLQEDRFYEMGRKERNWRKYDEEGNVILTSTFDNDILIKINGIKVNLEK